jgi:hypothetical protein
MMITNYKVRHYVTFSSSLLHICITYLNIILNKMLHNGYTYIYKYPI